MSDAMAAAMDMFLRDKEETVEATIAASCESHSVVLLFQPHLRNGLEH
jgi:hypothetical protein